MIALRGESLESNWDVRVELSRTKFKRKENETREVEGLGHSEEVEILLSFVQSWVGQHNKAGVGG